MKLNYFLLFLIVVFGWNIVLMQRDTEMWKQFDLQQKQEMRK